VLDLCAAPGGKTLQIADALIVAAEVTRLKGGQPQQTSLLTSAATGTSAAEGAEQTSLVTSAATAASSAGRVVAVDLPGDRLPRLRENLARVTGVEAVLVEADAAGPLDAALTARQLPAEYAAVLIDVPCSNTGVMRHRVDVKWRLQEGDFARHARQQLALLEAAARRVAPGGRLVYSTCSIDPEENEHVVAAFLRKSGEQFTLEAQAPGRPWETGCDGTGAFRLRRKA
jgi:16S rRNA (cytosine967-C5)-methyltransferase